MDNEKKKKQLEKVNNFVEALYEMRCSGVQLKLFQDGIIDTITLLDRESSDQIGEIAMGELFVNMTGGQVVDECALSTDYFGDLLDE